MFEGQPGRATVDVRDDTRTITMAFDFYADANEVKKLYGIISQEVEMQFFVRSYRRKIKGRLTSATDASGIIYGRWYRITLQFICDEPYFHDMTDTESGISAIVDKLPNYNESGEWYIKLPTVASERRSRTIVVNSGDIKVYPTIKLVNNKLNADAPDEFGLILTNHTTSASIRFDYNMFPDEEIVIDLAKRKITSSESGNITNSLSDDSFLYSFYLGEGENDIEFTSLNSNDNIVVTALHNNKYIGMVI